MTSTSNPFKETIQTYLEDMASNDLNFREHYLNKEKNINDCLTYILNTVQKSKRKGFTDAEVFGMALHYYEEENVKIGGKIKAQVIVNRKIELSPQQIEEERAKAKEKIYNEERAKLQIVRTPKRKSNDKEDKIIEQGRLF